MVKRLLAFVLFVSSLNTTLWAQDIDSIYFNLYVDSLRKGNYNYINVDGKLKTGDFIPLDSNHVKFRSSAGKWVNNSLVLDSLFAADSVVIYAQLKQRPEIAKTVTIYVKKVQILYELPTTEELLERWRVQDKKPRRRN